VTDNIKVGNVREVWRVSPGMPALIYVGRPSHLGNPFRFISKTDLQTALEKYDRYLIEKLQTTNAVSETFLKLLSMAKEKQVVLTCFCCPIGDLWTSKDPLRCHAQIIARELELRLQ